MTRNIYVFAAPVRTLSGLAIAVEKAIHIWNGGAQKLSKTASIGRRHF
jgi:hypothetical protein